MKRTLASLNVSPATKRRFESLGRMGETADGLLRRLLDRVEGLEKFPSKTAKEAK